MAQLSASVLRKYDWRAEIFIKKLDQGTSFEVVGGKKVELVKPKGVDKIIRDGSNAQLNALRFGGKDGKIYKLSDFVKTKEFGGKGEGASTAKEDMALASLREQISKAKMMQAAATIPVKIGSTTYSVFDAISTPGTPKSDFHLIDIDGKEVAWISHKDGTKAKDFQQWGGMSQRSEPTIYAHLEVRAFIDDLKQIYPDGLPRATTLAREIKDTKLKMMSVYGNEYGSRNSRQNTTLMLQGSVNLTKVGGYYKITAHHTHLNGDDMTGDYEPVFMAIFKGDRSDFGVKGTRIVIAPKGSRKITDFI
jgi:hypothetical protein